MFKAWFREVGSRTYATNGLEFETVEEARAYGNDLFSRWFKVDDFAILPVSPEFSGFVPQAVVDANKVGGR